jgi:PilZ domain/Gram-negative bacterial TonB protein C-terminal
MPGSQDYFGGITDARDRRSHSRQITTLNYITLGESNGGILLNISEDGLAFTAAEPLVGEFVPRLRFQLEEKAEWIEASGRIVWLNDSKKGAGIQFLDISDADRGQIRRWIESKNLSEIQDAERTTRKIRRETEVTPFPAPKSNTRNIEKQYEILEPHLQRMFPSENVLGGEAARPAQSHQVEAFNKTQPARADYFPSENDVRREVPVAPDPQVEIHSSSREGRHTESQSESVAHVPAAQTRFAQAVQVETLAETVTHQKETESAPLERAPLIEHSESVPERRPDSTAHTNQFLPSGLTGRSVRVPSFGYQSTSSPIYEKQDDWTNWVDPAASTHRSKLGFVVMGVLLVVAAFAIGLAFGHGSLEGFIENIREYVPDKYRQEPTANISAAESAPPAPKVEKTQTDTPAQADSDNSLNQASETPATASSQTPSSQPIASRIDNKETPATAASSQTDTDSASETGKPAAGEGDSTPVLISVAGSGSGPFRLTAPETAVSATSSVAVSSQATILVPREVGVDAAQEAKRLQLGTLVFRVDPQYPKKIGRGEVEIVKLLATVGENGQVTNVQQLSGSLPFATAAMSAIREWKYSPTLFDGRPVRTEEKITVAFRSH